MECVLIKSYRDVYEYMDAMDVTWRTADDFDRYYRGWLKTKPWYVPKASCAYYRWADEFHNNNGNINPNKLPEIWVGASRYIASIAEKVMLGCKRADGSEYTIPSIDTAASVVISLGIGRL